MHHRRGGERQRGLVVPQPASGRRTKRLATRRREQRARTRCGTTAQRAPGKEHRQLSLQAGGEVVNRSGDAEVLDLLALKGGALPSGVIRREGRHIANRELDELDDMTHQSAMEYPNAARMAISLVHPDRYWSMKRSP